MKKEGQVRQKMKQVVFRHLKNYIQEGLKRRPSNCVHNGLLKIPSGHTKHPVLRLCLFTPSLPDSWNNVTCDEKLGGCKQAKQCPHYEPLHSPEGLKAEFRTMLGLDGSPANIGGIAEHYPDVAALMFVLDITPGDWVGEPSEEEPEMLVLPDESVES